jgi:hypothetical protein
MMVIDRNQEGIHICITPIEGAKGISAIDTFPEIASQIHRQTLAQEIRQPVIFYLYLPRLRTY